MGWFLSKMGKWTVFWTSPASQLQLLHQTIKYKTTIVISSPLKLSETIDFWQGITFILVYCVQQLFVFFKSNNSLVKNFLVCLTTSYELEFPISWCKVKYTVYLLRWLVAVTIWKMACQSCQRKFNCPFFIKRKHFNT